MCTNFVKFLCNSRYWALSSTDELFQLIRLLKVTAEIIFCRVLGLPSDFKEGVVFSTYATLVSSVNRAGTSYWISSLNIQRKLAIQCPRYPSNNCKHRQNKANNQ